MPDPPPTTAAGVAVWCGSSNGGPRIRPPARVERARHRVHRGDLDRLASLEIGQQPGQPRGQHRLAGARRPDQQQVVPAGGGDLEGRARLAPAPARRPGRPAGARTARPRVGPGRSPARAPARGCRRRAAPRTSPRLPAPTTPLPAPAAPRRRPRPAPRPGYRRHGGRDRGQHPAHRPEPSVEAELAEVDDPVQPSRRSPPSEAPRPPPASPRRSPGRTRCPAWAATPATGSP